LSGRLWLAIHALGPGWEGKLRFAIAGTDAGVYLPHAWSQTAVHRIASKNGV